MKGKLIKTEQGWVVDIFIKTHTTMFYVDKSISYAPIMPLEPTSIINYIHLN